MAVRRWEKRLAMLFVFSSFYWTTFHLVYGNPANDTGIESDEMYRAIWKGYEKSVRPLCSTFTTPSVVSMGIALRQLQEVNEPKQILATNLWIRVAWTECRLTWTMAEWNVSRLVVPYNTLWTPDLTLYDNAEEKLEGMESYRLSVKSTGAVSQQFPVVAKSLCQLDVSGFPFDTQICNLTFGSWAYHGYEVNLTARAKAVDLSAYVSHGEWELISLTVQRVEPVFDGIPYPQVIFTLVLRRRHLFYILSLVFPGGLIHMMAILAFLLPCESNEKVGLVITVLLSLAVMQLVILDLIPPSSETLPIIGVYFTLSMGVVSMSCLMTVIVLAVNYPNRHRPPPHWARAVLDTKAARWLGVDTSSLQLLAKMHEDGKSWSHSAPKGSAYTAMSHPNHDDHQQQHSNSNRQLATSAQIAAAYNRHSQNSKVNPVPGTTVVEELEMTSVSGYSGSNTPNASLNPIPGFNPGNPHHHHHHHHQHPPHNHAADVSGSADVAVSNALNNNVSGSDSDVSFYYSREGDRERRTRVCYRPLSADAANMAQILESRQQLQAEQQDQLVLHPLHWELHEMVSINQQILDCMKRGKKGPEHHKEKASNKVSKREWELLAVFLDRIFLIVFCLLSLVVFVYTYTTILN